jgi:hypothetical protein
MTTAGRAYVVRDADGGSGEVTNVYAYTLKGLTTALEDARFRSFHGGPQAVVVMRDGQSAVIRRFELGREVPVASLRSPRQPTGRLPAARARIITLCLNLEFNLFRVYSSLCAVCGDIHHKGNTMTVSVQNV